MTSFRVPTWFALLVLAVGSAGCVSRRTSCAPPTLTRASGLVPVRPTPDEPQVLETDLVKSLADRLRAESRYEGTSPTRPTRSLALSGGGMYGAYGVGVLAGWTATGTRPEFDSVTGISTGALIATYAFLGTAYDRRMAEAYTSITDRDVFRRRLPGAVLWTESAASSAPLARLIESLVDDDVLRAVAAAHVAGRRLYVGTTNLNTKRLVIWDMGAIAAGGRPDAGELFRKVLLASASVPGFFPPVEFDVRVNGRRYSELHADGGATTGVFLRTAASDTLGPSSDGRLRPPAGSEATS